MARILIGEIWSILRLAHTRYYSEDLNNEQVRYLGLKLFDCHVDCHLNPGLIKFSSQTTILISVLNMEVLSIQCRSEYLTSLVFEWLKTVVVKWFLIQAISLVTS